MQETPQMGAVVDNPASVAIVATAGTNFYLVFAVFAGLLGNWSLFNIFRSLATHT
jgi:hypothetical protein